MWSVTLRIAVGDRVERDRHRLGVFHNTIVEHVDVDIGERLAGWNRDGARKSRVIAARRGRAAHRVADPVYLDANAVGQRTDAPRTSADEVAQ